MADTHVEVTEGSGKKLHAYSRSIGGATVYDEAMVLAEAHLPA